MNNQIRNSKWFGFFAGLSLAANALALLVLMASLGLTPDSVRNIAVAVLILDLMVEAVVFIRSWSETDKKVVFFAGISAMLNVLAIIMLLVPLGLSINLIRNFVVVVIGIDALTELVAFALSGRNTTPTRGE